MTSFIKTLSFVAFIAGSVARASEVADQLAGTSWVSEKKCATIHFGAKNDDSDALNVEVGRVQILTVPGCGPQKTTNGSYSFRPVEADMATEGFDGILVQEHRDNTTMNLGLASWLRIVTAEDQSTMIELTPSKIESGKVSILAPIKLRKVK